MACKSFFRTQQGCRATGPKEQVRAQHGVARWSAVLECARVDRIAGASGIDLTSPLCAGTVSALRSLSCAISSAMLSTLSKLWSEHESSGAMAWGPLLQAFIAFAWVVYALESWLDLRQHKLFALKSKPNELTFVSQQEFDKAQACQLMHAGRSDSEERRADSNTNRKTYVC